MSSATPHFHFKVPTHLHITTHQGDVHVLPHIQVRGYGRDKAGTYITYEPVDRRLEAIYTNLTWDEMQALFNDILLIEARKPESGSVGLRKSDIND